MRSSLVSIMFLSTKNVFSSNSLTFLGQELKSALQRSGVLASVCSRDGVGRLFLFFVFLYYVGGQSDEV